MVFQCLPSAQSHLIISMAFFCQHHRRLTMAILNTNAINRNHCQPQRHQRQHHHFEKTASGISIQGHPASSAYQYYRGLGVYCSIALQRQEKRVLVIQVFRLNHKLFNPTCNTTPQTLTQIFWEPSPPAPPLSCDLKMYTSTARTARNGTIGIKLSGSVLTIVTMTAMSFWCKNCSSLMQSPQSQGTQQQTLGKSLPVRHAPSENKGFRAALGLGSRGSGLRVDDVWFVRVSTFGV